MSETNSILTDDLYRYEGEGCKSLKTKLKYFFFVPGFQFIYFLRKASGAGNVISKFFWAALHRLCMFHTQIQIPIGTKIGRGFRISHFGSIIINGGAVIGKNFNISSGCLIGYSEGKHKGIPTIGNNVIMNVNSVIVGGGKSG